MGSKRQRFKDENVQSALDEITRLVRHRRIPPEDQEENTPLLLIVKRRITTVFTLKLPDAGISLKLCPMERVGTEAMHLNQPHR